MKIGFDGKRFFFNSTGLGNYSRSTIAQLGRFYPENSYYIFTPKATPQGLEQAAAAGASVHTPCHLAGRLFPSVWRSVFMEKTLAAHNLDIFHGLSHELPLLKKVRNIKRVVTMHDLIFLRYPELYSRVDALIYKKKYLASCRNADMIIATSKQTKNDLIDFFQIPPQKIRVVYQSCDPRFYNKQDKETLHKTATRLSLPSAYILFVGSLSARKQPDTLIQALSLLPPAQRLPLIFVGTGSSAYTRKLRDLAHQLQLNELVHFRGRVAIEDLPALYQLATVFVYPSLFEGFGIPVLEALFSEVPVITSNAACMREVGGPHSLYTQPGNARELAEVLARVLGNSEQRRLMAGQGRQYAEQFHATNSAASLMACYQEVLGI